MGKHTNTDNPVDHDSLGPWVRAHLEAPRHVAEPQPPLAGPARASLVSEYRALGIDPALIDIIDGPTPPPRSARSHVNAPCSVLPVLK